MNREKIVISRHRRLIIYAIVATVLAFIGHFSFDFSREQTIAYAVTAYFLLNVLNYRSLLTRITESSEAHD